MEPELPFLFSRDAERQRLDRFLAHAAFRCSVFGAGHTRWPEFHWGSSGIRSPGTQLWIPASQLLDLGPRTLSSGRRIRHYSGGVGLRDAVGTGLSQSGAVARRTTARLPPYG